MRLNKLTSIFAAIALTLAATGCSDDDTVKEPESTPVVSDASATYNSLSFSWKPVKSVIQYGYKLFKADDLHNPINGGVTTATELSFTDLEPSTDYVLNVWCFTDPASNITTSKPLVLNGRTDDLIPLETPAVVGEQTANTVEFSWDEVEYASGYLYALKNADGTVLASDTITETSISYALEESVKLTCNVTALTEEPGYCNSAVGTATFECTFVELPSFTVSTSDPGLEEYSPDYAYEQDWHMTLDSNGDNLNDYIQYDPDNDYYFELNPNDAITIDLGAETAVQGLKFSYWYYADYDYYYSSTAFTNMQYSLDGVNWELIEYKATAGQDTENYSPIWLVFNRVVNARYIKYTEVSEYESLITGVGLLK